MQPDRFTIKSQEAVAASQRLASEHRNPEVAPAHLLLALLDPEEGLVVPVLQKLGADVASIRQRALAAVEGLPRISGECRAGGPPLAGFRSHPAARREGDGRARRRVHLHRAHPARPRRQGLGAGGAAARPRGAGQGNRRGARPTSRHLPEPRGHDAGAGEVRPRPDRRGGAGQARPGDRPRRGDPAGDPGALAADQEQPGADRRSRRRQDRDRRGTGAADRRRRRPREPSRPPGDRARHRRAARRLQVPGRVRGAAEGGAEGDSGRRGPDRPVHGRAAHDRRRRRGRGRGRRREPA